MKGDRQHGAERRAAGDAERVRCRQRIAQQRLKDHAGGGERGADQRRREHARQARDEEDLRVGVVGEGDRAIEDARERNVCRADQWAGDERRGE